MILLRRALLFLAFFVFVCPCQLRAETLPDRRPAMIGSGAGSLVDLINVNALFEKGQRVLAGLSQWQTDRDELHVYYMVWSNDRMVSRGSSELNQLAANRNRCPG